ncbi:MAG TPA: glycerol-3-phosphate dehydrogenase [Burkholderiaceae bacterium]|nr:glycerol-3-phosphate dehydrogenase [Burkholderiaceae bacterium]
MSVIPDPLPGCPPNAPAQCDLLVVGGGINGASIARDAAGRGLSVVLCERDDLASHTSSASTKLIHGGLRYLEHYEFALVRKALIEREVLLRSAPHIMWPLRFVMPHDPSMRPAWLIRAGLLLYDHLARRRVLPGSAGIDLRRHVAGAPLQTRFTRGFVYSDGWVDDARLVVLNARDAADRGAQVLTRTACVDARRGGDGWLATLQRGDGSTVQVSARALVNAAGPWAASFLEGQAHQPARHGLRLIKGSHIVVPRLFEHDHAYIFQSPDGRIVFAIPFEGRFTLIGTTDVEHHGDPGSVGIEAGEIDYLCGLISRYFRQSVSPADVVWQYSGVRPLLDDESGDPSAVTRDYALELDRAGAPLLSVWGGKITTSRKLAEEAVDALLPALGLQRDAWTGSALLPGGDLSAVIGPASRPDLDFERFVRLSGERRPWLPATLLHRWARAYGSRIERLLEGVESMAQLGEAVAPGLHEREIDFLRREEWVQSAQDLLWRRSKLGLHLTDEQRAAVERFMAGRPA